MGTTGVEARTLGLLGLGLSANISTLYRHLPFTERLGAAAADGFGCVEFWTAEDHAAVEREVARLRLAVASVNVDGSAAREDAGGLSDPAAVAVWRRRFAEVLRLARAIGSRAINVPAGRLADDTSAETARATAAENLAWALAQTHEPCPVLLLEPLSRADRPGYLLGTFEEAAALRAELGDPDGLRILFDAYHLHQSSDDVCALLEREIGVVGHVQIADFPGRGAPGTGEIEFDRLLGALARSGYDGWVGLEYVAGAETTASLTWIAQAEEEERP
jgi:hydroxypyruvate isomerase